MAIAHEFAYHRPTTLAEAVRLLARPKTQVLAGGTDLVGWLRDGLVEPRALVDLKGIPGLDRIEFRAGRLHIGALVTFSTLIASRLVRERFPLLVEAAMTVASPGIRNRATLVGNICSAVPACDAGPALLVDEAEVVVRGARRSRVVPMVEWFKGPRKTALRAGEVVTGLEVPSPGRKHGFAYVKLGRYRGEDLAQAGVAVVALSRHRYRVAYGAVAPTPLRGTKVEAHLAGRALGPSVVAEVRKLALTEVAPITDLRASREYREHMLEAMLERALRLATSRLAGDGPPPSPHLLS